MKRGVTVFLDPEDMKYIEDSCKRTGQSKSSLIRQIIKDYIRREKNIEG